MIVKNKLSNDLQIPNGYGDGISMVLEAHGIAEIKEVSPSLRAAEASGLVEIIKDREGLVTSKPARRRGK